MNNPTDAFTIEATLNFTFTKEQILELLASAFEGGSNYWIDSIDIDNPASVQRTDKDEYWHWSQWTPVYGGSLFITTVDAEIYILNQDALQKGMTLLASQCPDHFADIILHDNADADTADAYLQLCLFDGIVYG